MLALVDSNFDFNSKTYLCSFLSVTFDYCRLLV